MTLHFHLTLDEDGRCRQMYLLYVASADALTNRRRRAANIVRVLCQSEEGDHIELLIELNRGREH